MEPNYHVRMSHAAKEFLRRADLKGAEVDQFGRVWNWLNEISIGQTVVISIEAAKEFEDMKLSDLTDGDEPVVVNEG